MKKLLIANWKSNPPTRSRALRLARAINSVSQKANHGVEIAVASPYPFFELIKRAMRHVELAAQDVSWSEGGPYTGEVSAEQLRSVGVKYVIIGHSERREHSGENDELVNRKLHAALRAGLYPVLCIGEGVAVRNRGIHYVKSFLTNQLQKDLKGVGSRGVTKLTIAYEPLWAISTERGSKPDKPEDVAGVIIFIKKILYTLHPRVLYGGSVNGKNADAFLSREEIDGALVGGASLDARQFQRIIMAASEK